MCMSSVNAKGNLRLDADLRFNHEVLGCKKTYTSTEISLTTSPPT